MTYTSGNEILSLVKMDAGNCPAAGLPNAAGLSTRSIEAQRFITDNSYSASTALSILTCAASADSTTSFSGNEMLSLVKMDAGNCPAAGLPNAAGLQKFLGGLSPFEIAAVAVVIGGLATGAFTTDDLYSATLTASSLATYADYAIKIYSATTAIADSAIKVYSATTAGLGLMETTAAIATVGAAVATGLAFEVFSMEQVIKVVKIGAIIETELDFLPQADDLYSAANDLYSAGNDLYSAASSLWDTLPSSSTFYNIFS